MPEKEPEYPFENWSLLNLRNKIDLEIFDKTIFPMQGFSLPAQAMRDYLLKPPKGKKLSLCRYALIENDYFDQDFIDSYCTFYAKGYRDIIRSCKRIHFFSCKIEASDVMRFGELKKFQNSYLGFCVIRPLVTKLGRTVLRPRRESPSIEFHTCNGRFLANIAGEDLCVDSAPFMEQDGRVQTCSSVAIWISTSIMAHCFGYPKYSTSEILANATRTILGTRVGPTDGLTYEQMMIVLRDMAYEPIILDERDSKQAIHDIYSYVESAVPPILLLALPDGTHHAVVALGHAHRRPFPSEASLVSVLYMGEPLFKYYRSSEWVPHFYIHDDQRGVYRKLEFIAPDSTELERRILSSTSEPSFATGINVDLAKWHCPVSIKIDSTVDTVPQEAIANIWGVIVPLPKGISLSHTEAEWKATQIIKSCMDHLQMDLPKDLVLRQYLIPSNIYKSSMDQDSNLNGFIKSLYRGKSMPKWLWLIEMSTANLMNKEKLKDIRIRGELILDASSNPLQNDFIAFHWVNINKGYVVTMTQDDADIDEALRGRWLTGPDKPYHPMIR